MGRAQFADEVAEVITTGAKWGARWGWQPQRRERFVVVLGCVLGFLVGVVGDWSPLWFWSVVTVLAYLVGRPVVHRGLWTRRKRQQFADAHRACPPPSELRRMRKVETARVKYLRQQWPAACRSFKVLDEVKQPPGLRKLTSTVDGDFTATVYPGDQVIAGGGGRIVENRAGFAEIVGCRNLVVRRNRPGVFDLTFLWTDEFERDLPIQKLPQSKKPGRIVYGIHRDGTPATLDPNKSTIVAGVQGSGKSSLVWCVLAHFLRAGEWVDLYVIDPKGGQEWGWLQRMATINTCRVKVREFVTDDAGATRMLTKVAAVVKERQEKHGTVDLEDWSADPVRQHIPTREDPRIVVLADELLHVRATIKDTATKPSPFGKIISIGRSECASVIAVTQDATKETVGMVRDLFGQRVALRTSSSAMTDMVLAAGAESAGATCSLIPESTPGIGFAYDADHHGFAEVRIAHVTDDDIRNDIQWGRPPSGMIGGEVVTVEPYVVYRIVTSDDQPLRVGITNSWDRRAKEYAASYAKERAAIEAGYLDPSKALYWWWPDADLSRTRLRDCDSKAEAKALESQFIATGAWRGNHQENMNASLRNVPTVAEPAHRRLSLVRRTAPPPPPLHPADLPVVKEWPLYDQQHDQGWQSDLRSAV